MPFQSALRKRAARPQSRSLSRREMPIGSLISAIALPRNHLLPQGFLALLNVNVC